MQVELAARIDEKRVWSRPPISMEFQVPMYTASGLHVRFLKIIEKEVSLPRVLVELWSEVL